MSSAPLIRPDSGLPIGVRYRTDDADQAHRALRDATTTPNEDVLRTAYAPPMFSFPDAEGNTAILIERDGDQEWIRPGDQAWRAAAWVPGNPQPARPDA